MESERYYVLDCVIAPENNAISRGNKHVHLEPKVMDCLVFFLTHSNQILTRDELIHSVWHDRVVNEEAVNRIIYRIRSAFHELGIEQELLITHRKRGYQWTMHAEHAHQAAPPDIDEVIKTADNFRWLATIALGVCFAILIAVVSFWPQPNAAFDNSSSTSDKNAPCEWPADIEAIEHYFTAKSLMGRRGDDELNQAIEHLNNAIKISPNFAKAWSTLAYAHDLLPVHTLQGQFHPSSMNHYDAAINAAKHALAICPSSAEAYMIAGEVPTDWQFNPLGEHYYRIQHALKLEPNNTEIARAAGEFYWRMGYLSMAMEWFENAEQMDPWNGRVQVDLADALLQQGMPSDAEATLLNAEEFGFETYGGDRVSWLRVYLARGDYSAARSLLKYKTPIKGELISAFIDWHQTQDQTHLTHLRQRLSFALSQTPIEAYLVHKLALLADLSDIAAKAWLASDHTIAQGYTLWWPGAGKLFDHAAFQAWVVDSGYFAFWQKAGIPDTCRARGEYISCLH